MSVERGRGRPPHDDVLTPAEWRVTEAVRNGLTNPAIADRLGVSADAVKFHVANALQKTRLRQPRRPSALGRCASGQSLARKNEKRGKTDLQLGQIGQVSRSVTDISAARRWYAEVLGLRHLYSFGDLAFFDCSGVRLFLSQGEARPESILYLTVGDIHGASAMLAARGIKFRNAPHRSTATMMGPRSG